VCCVFHFDNKLAVCVELSLFSLLNSRSSDMSQQSLLPVGLALTVGIGISAALGFGLGISVGILHNPTAPKYTNRKLISVRRLGDRVGRPIVAGRWDDIISVFSGSRNRIFFPNGDEILEKDRTQDYFDLLPSQQLLYVAPNGEDFNPIEVFERLDEQQMQNQSELYTKLVQAIFHKSVPKYVESKYGKGADAEDEGKFGEYVKHCLEKYVFLTKAANDVFCPAPGGGSARS